MQAQEGKMFLFGSDPYRRLPVFLSGKGNRCLVVVGGQTDGFFSLGYVGSLVSELGKTDWSVAQVQLSSNHPGCSGNHVQDGRDLDDLIKILLVTHEMKEVVLFGFSTGVQIVLECMKEGKNVEGVTRVILQGVCHTPEESDLHNFESAAKRLAAAKECVAKGQGESYGAMEKHYDIPVTASRVASGGFLSIQEAVWMPAMAGEVQALRATLSVIRCPLLVMFARQGIDKYQLADEEKVAKAAVESASATADVGVAAFEEVCDERRRMLNTAHGSHTVAVVMFLQEQDNRRKEREDQARLVEAEKARRNRSILAKSEMKLLGD